jgi:hypothetical protein
MKYRLFFDWFVYQILFILLTETWTLTKLEIGTENEAMCNSINMNEDASLNNISKSVSKTKTTADTVSLDFTGDEFSSVEFYSLSRREKNTEWQSFTANLKHK